MTLFSFTDIERTDQNFVGRVMERYFNVMKLKLTCTTKCEQKGNFIMLDNMNGFVTSDPLTHLSIDEFHRID